MGFWDFWDKHWVLAFICFPMFILVGFLLIESIWVNGCKTAAYIAKILKG